MHRHHAFVAAVIVAVAATSCSNSPTAPTDPSLASGGYMAAQLEGMWQLSSIQPAGQAKQNRPDGATYTLSFADGRLSTRADCNICGGTFSISGVTLSAGPILACTRAACATVDFETAYTALLGGDSSTVISKDTLTLTSPRGVLTFTR